MEALILMFIMIVQFHVICICLWLNQMHYRKVTILTIIIYIIIRNIFTMIDLQRMPKHVMEHRYCVTEHISIEICRLFPLFQNCSITNYAII